MQRLAIAGVIVVHAVTASGQTAAVSPAHRMPVVPQAVLERPIELRANIGVSHDRVEGTTPEAQRFYDQGLSYLHNYVWIEAARSFNQALRLDPQLALAHVGLSYAYIELNKTQPSRQAIATAQKLAANADDHVKQHVNARALQ